MRCGAIRRERQTEDEEDPLCAVCVVEMEVLMRDELAMLLGRPPGEAEFDIFIDRVLARATDRRRGKP